MTTCLALLALLVSNPKDPYLERFPFSSPEEAEIIKTWVYEEKLNTDIVSALLVAEGITDPAQQQTFKDKLDDLQGTLRKKADGKGSKGAKAVYKHLHKNVLYTYEPLARFQDVFNMGSSYNCVTSTSLFAVVCQGLNIPVTLYVTPNHVFGSVKNNKGKVLRVEMTDPVKGFGFKTGIKESLDYLKRYKLVTEAELKEKGERQIYLEFVNQAREIPMVNLLAITYFNQTYGHRVQKRYEDGVRTTAKSLFIDPKDEQSKELLKAVIGQYFTSYDFSEKPLSSLAEVCRAALHFLPDDPEFLKKVVDGTLHQIHTVHREESPQEEVLAFVEELVLTTKDFPPIKRNVVRMHRSLIGE